MSLPLPIEGRHQISSVQAVREGCGGVGALDHVGQQRHRQTVRRVLQSRGWDDMSRHSNARWNNHMEGAAGAEEELSDQGKPSRVLLDSDEQRAATTTHLGDVGVHLGAAAAAAGVGDGHCIQHARDVTQHRPIRTHSPRPRSCEVSLKHVKAL